MKLYVVNFVMVLHRAIFTASAALLGVGGSLLAEDATSVSNWGLVVGPTFLMYLEDVCGVLETDAQKLAVSSSRPIREVRASMFNQKRPAVLFSVLAVGVVALFGGLALRATDGRTVEAKLVPTTEIRPLKAPEIVCSETKSKKAPRLRCTSGGRPVPVSVRQK